MNEIPLIRDDEPRPGSGRGWLLGGVGALLAAAIVAAIAWWFLAGRTATPGWERVAELDLEAPAGDAFLPGTPWVRLRLAPGRPGEENTLRLSLAAPDGTPEAGDRAAARITALSARLLAATADGGDDLPLTPDGTGELLAKTPLAAAGVALATRTDLIPAARGWIAERRER